jgi:hypothetical protein
MRYLRAGLLLFLTAATIGGCYAAPPPVYGYGGYGYGGYACRRVWVPGSLYRAGYYRCI